MTASAENTASSIAAAEANLVLPALETIRRAGQPRERAVEDRHIGAKTNRHPRGLGSRDAAAEHRDPRRRDPRNAAEQKPRPPFWR